MHLLRTYNICKHLQSYTLLLFVRHILSLRLYYFTFPGSIMRIVWMIRMFQSKKVVSRKVHPARDTKSTKIDTKVKSWHYHGLVKVV